MPISEENKKRYPSNWKFISLDIRTNRAGNRCEKCGIKNGDNHPRTGKKQTLTVAHLDHIPEHCDYSNLLALCNVCHNQYDKKHRIESAYLRKHNNNYKLIIPP
jgi:hypothetical protein